METIKIIFSNYYINVAFLSLADSAGSQDAVDLCIDKEVVWGKNGGCRRNAKCALSTGLFADRCIGENWDFLHRNLRFRLPLLPSLCMMRWVCAGQPEQAKVLNKIVEMTSDNIKEMFAPRKREISKSVYPPQKHGARSGRTSQNGRRKSSAQRALGHTQTEVLAGAVLGVAIAMLMPVF